MRHEVSLYPLRPKLAISRDSEASSPSSSMLWGSMTVKQAFGDYDWRALLPKDGHVVTKIEFTVEAPPKPKRSAAA